MPTAPELGTAFDAALRQVQRALSVDMRTASGESARRQLEQLGAELQARRDIALETGGVDPEWVRSTVRAVVAWAPASELALIAALGGIARASGRSPGG